MLQLSTLSSAVLVAGILPSLLQVSGQIVSNTQCMSNFSWSDNSLGQNPCLVAAYLEGACNGGNSEIDPLISGYHYIGPSLDSANPCQCSTTFYCLVSACGACQGGIFLSWSQWSFNCSSTLITSGYPFSIPDGTAVPNWAYQDVISSDNFDPSEAEEVGDTPETTPSLVSSIIASTTTSSTTASAQPTTTSAQPTTTSAQPTTVFVTQSSAPDSSPTTRSSAAASSNQKKSNVGAIVGGAVGGLVALAAFILLLFCLVKRNSRTAPGLTYDASTRAPRPPVSAGYYQESFSGKSPMNPSFGAAPASYAGSPPMSQMPAQNSYDASNPATFPSPMSDPTSVVPGPYPVNSLGYHPSSGHGSAVPSGHYSGVPEV